MDLSKILTFLAEAKSQPSRKFLVVTEKAVYSPIFLVGWNFSSYVGVSDDFGQLIVRGETTNLAIAFSQVKDMRFL